MKALNILIVEDERMIAETLAEIIDLLQHNILGHAISGEQALAILKEQKPDLVLLDIQLKGQMDGIDVAGVIRDKYKLPFIFTTAFADDETINRARAEGPFGYLVKPYGVNDIKAAIEVAMANYELMQELSDTNPAPAHHENGQIYLKEDKKLVKVREEDILYVEAKGDYMLFKTAKGSHIVLSTMSNVSQKLNPILFLQVHRSFLINLNHIMDIEDTTLVIDKKVIPISRAKRKELLSRIKTI